jgi:hypothetical protein
MVLPNIIDFFDHCVGTTKKILKSELSGILKVPGTRQPSSDHNGKKYRSPVPFPVLATVKSTTRYALPEHTMANHHHLWNNNGFSPWISVSSQSP